MADRLQSAVKTGVMSGLVAWHICLVGLLETFAERNLVGESITMGYVMLVALMLIAGYMAGRRSTQPSQSLISGTVAGMCLGIMLLALALLTNAVELNAIFMFATDHLIELLTLHQGLEQSLGLAIPIVSSLVCGFFGSVLAILPHLWRRTITLSLVITTCIALLRDVTAVLLPDDVRKAIFTSTGLTPPAAITIFLLSATLIAALSFYQAQQSRVASSQQPPGTRSWKWWTSMAVLSIFLLSYPLWSKAFLSNVAGLVGLYIIMGMGLNLVIGFAGMLDLGFVAFYALGAYTMALLTSPEIASRFLDQPMETGFMPFWAALPFSMLVAMMGGAILALPILKMRGDYLAIATLGFGEIIRILALSDFLKPYMGGAQGITRIARPEIGDFVIKDPQQFYYIILAGCLIAWFVGNRLKHSRMGRAWMAIREDEDVAQAMGINRVTAKLAAFVIGAFLGGLSGGIFASFVGSVVPRSFELLISINVLALIIVGGMGSLPGVVVGAVVMVGLPELLREFREYRMLVYGAVVVIMMLYRPQGLWPEQAVARQFQVPKEEEIPPDKQDDVPMPASSPQTEVER